MHTINKLIFFFSCFAISFLSFFVLFISVDWKINTQRMKIIFSLCVRQFLRLFIHFSVCTSSCFPIKIITLLSASLLLLLQLLLLSYWIVAGVVNKTKYIFSWYTVNPIKKTRAKAASWLLLCAGDNIWTAVVLKFCGTKSCRTPIVLHRKLNI